MSDMNRLTNSRPYKVEVSSRDPAWQDFLRDHPQSTIYHRPRWGEVMRRAYGNQPFYLTARRDDKIKAVLQLIAQKSLLFGSHFCSVPYFDSAGVLADDPDSLPALIEQARSLLNRQRAQWVELRHLAAVDETLPSRTDKVTMILTLPTDEEELWRSFSPKVRNQVRKAQRADLQVTQGSAELLDEFYGIYVRNMRDLGSPPHSRRFFSLILEHFPEEAKLFVVRQENRTLAAGFTLADQRALRVPWAASDWRLRSLNANMLLYWSMLAEGCRIKVTAFDFGRSTRDSGTYSFKKQWGTEEITLVWEYLLPEGASLPELRPDSSKYRFMVACWKRLPLPLARMLGPRLIRKLS